MHKLIRTLNDFNNCINYNEPLFSDTETYEDIGKTDGGLYGKVRLIQIYQKGWKEAYMFDCMFVDFFEVLEIIKPGWLVFHNGSFDLHTINCNTDELWFPAKADDTMYASKFAYPDQTKFDFYSCLDHAGVSDKHIESIDKKAQQKSDWSQALMPDQLRYAAYDVLYLSLLWEKIKYVLPMEGYRLDIKNQQYSIEYDRVGMPVNIDTITQLQQLHIRKSEKYKRLCPVNVNSPKQCNAWLGTTSTNANTLGVMALKGNTDAENLIKARQHTKMLGFLKKYKAPFIRGFHNAAGARTGRMTCKGGNRYFCDNTQNPPHAMFSAFEAPPGKVMVYKDYSGLELRMAVTWCGEPTMYAMMMQGKDMHTETGCYLFDKTPETLPKELRTITKFYNFGTAYGAYPQTLRELLRSQARIDLSLKKVTELRTKWLTMYNYFDEWHKIHKRQMQIYGYLDIVTALGRPIRAYSLNDSLNFPIQGSSAEVTKVAVDNLYKRYKTPDIINVVHDSITLLKDEGNEAELWVERLNECMIDAWYYVIKDLAYPDLTMPAEAEIKKRWKY